MEPDFSAAASFGISVNMGLPYGLHQGILTVGRAYSPLMIRNFNPSRPTFTTSDQSPMPLRTLTLWKAHGAELVEPFVEAAFNNLPAKSRTVLFQCMSTLPNG